MRALTCCVSALGRLDLADGTFQGPSVGPTAIHALDPLADGTVVLRRSVEADADRLRERLADAWSAVRESVVEARGSSALV